MLLELMLEFHAWSTVRPTHETESTAKALEKEMRSIVETEDEQGRSSISLPPPNSLVGRRRSTVSVAIFCVWWMFLVFTC